MLIPTKHERLSQNSLVLGADILGELDTRPFDAHSLYELLRKTKGISLEQFFDCVTFLWLTEAVSITNFQITKCS